MTDNNKESHEDIDLVGSVEDEKMGEILSKIAKLEIKVKLAHRRVARRAYKEQLVLTGKYDKLMKEKIKQNKHKE